MSRMMALCVVVAIFAGALGLSNALASDCSGSQAKGTVTAACPEGGKLSMKTECGKEVTFGVTAKAREQVKSLKAGDKVEVSTMKCPQSGQVMVKSVCKSCGQ